MGSLFLENMHYTFGPGPSQLFPQVKHFLAEAYDSGILSASHRSAAFDKLSAETLSLLRKRLKVPADYCIFYTISATENWEIIPQSLTKQGSLHIHSGSFGAKWFDYAQKLWGESAVSIAVGPNEIPAPDAFSHIGKECDVICLTQNETSNGSQIRPDLISAWKSARPNALIAVDVTSSLNGVLLPLEHADIWFASVQKCFGLPAGLGLMIASPQAIEKAQEIGDKKHYNSFLVLKEFIEKYQTSHTPNVLGIYLLNRVLGILPTIEETHLKTIAQAQEWYSFISEHPDLDLLVKQKPLQSDTVITVLPKGGPDAVAYFKKKAELQGLQLGSGYGKWKPDTFRIANFPALPPEAHTQLMEVLSL